MHKKWKIYHALETLTSIITCSAPKMLNYVDDNLFIKASFGYILFGR